MDAHLPLARAHLGRLVYVRTLKAVGPLPVFGKCPRSALARLLRIGLIVGTRGAEATFGSERWPSRVPIPDLIAERHRREFAKCD